MRATDYPAGTLKRHPDWPTVPAVAMRTAFTDGQFPGWTSWMQMTPTGSEFVAPETVADWPIADVTAAP